MEQPDHATDIDGIGTDTAHWSAEELAAMSSLRGCGRVMTVRPGHGRDRIDDCLRGAGYRVGRLVVTREATHLPQAVASFAPDVVFVRLQRPIDACLDALEAIATDPRTLELPIVAMVEGETPAAVIEEAYTRSGCDFLRLGGSHVELLARTHLLVRLSSRAFGLGVPPPPQRDPMSAANAPTGARLDLRDPITGVYSATYFRHRLQQEVARSHRYQRPLTLIAVRCPSACDDATAARIAAVLFEVCRNVDLVARLDPDLFAVLLPETPADASGAVTARIGEQAAAGGLRCSIGAAGLGASEQHGAHAAPALLRLACARADKRG
jgi:PleD family two-component response regulator